MIVSAARRVAAAVVSRGETERTAARVQAALSGRVRRAAPEDIARIVRHAQAQVPFHRRRAGTPFDDLPVISKPMMLEAPRDFFADGVRPERLTSRLSSGTSGVMFRSFFDAARIARHQAELVGAYRFLGADPFGTFLHCREWFQVTRRERLAHALRGQRLSSAEQDEATVRATVRWLRRHRGTVLIGLCSYLEVLLGRIEELGLDLPPGCVSVVLGTGEPMGPRLADLSRRRLGVEPALRYSSTELGLLGFTEPGATRYHLDLSTFHVEILDLDEDVPAAPGAVGRIVVTDLYNRAMPFLRYDTGDLGRFAVDGSGRPMPHLLEELTGRRRDIPLAGTADAPRRATHFAILEPVEQIPGIRQFQLCQHDLGRFTWIVNAPPSEEMDAVLRRILDEQIGDIISCEIVHTDEPLHTGAGKRQTFVTEIPDPEALLRRAAGG